MSRTAVLANPAAALSNEGVIERNGNVLLGITRQLGYAGVNVTARQLAVALDRDSVDHPSVFGPMPALSTHYGTNGTEYRFRPTDEVRDATRACVDAVYAVTDTMDRTPQPVTLKDGSTIEIETIRPHAFAIAMGHLRVRWAKGNYSKPRAATIRRWVGLA